MQIMPQPPHWTTVYVAELRERSKQMKSFGDNRGAVMCDEVAREIEARRSAWEDEELTPVQAAKECGYTPENLRRLKKIGQWSGRRGDLPRRPIITRPALVASDNSSTSIADRVLSRQDGRETRRRRSGR